MSFRLGALAPGSGVGERGNYPDYVENCDRTGPVRVTEVRQPCSEQKDQHQGSESPSTATGGDDSRRSRLFLPDDIVRLHRLPEAHDERVVQFGRRFACPFGPLLIDRSGNVEVLVKLRVEVEAQLCGSLGTGAERITAFIRRMV